MPTEALVRIVARSFQTTERDIHGCISCNCQGYEPKTEKGPGALNDLLPSRWLPPLSQEISFGWIDIGYNFSEQSETRRMSLHLHQNFSKKGTDN